MKTLFNGFTEERSRITYISHKRGDMYGVIQHKKIPLPTNSNFEQVRV
jgi:hypothetical protein